MSEINFSFNSARKLLREIGELSEHASLTRSMQGGAPRVAERYNAVLRFLIREGQVPADLFNELDPMKTNFDELGVEARMLIAFVSEDKKSKKEDFGPVVALAPFLNSSDLAQMIREKMDQGIDLADDLLPALAPFLESETLGELIRRRTNTPKPAPSPSPSPQPAASNSLVPVDNSESLESLAIRLRDPELPQEARAQIALRLAQIAHEEASQHLE